MALNDNALVTLEAVKRRLGIAPDDTSQDAELEDYINEISQFVETYTGRRLKAQDYTDEIIQLSDQHVLLPLNYPINSVTKLETGYFSEGIFIVSENENDWFLNPLKYGIVKPGGWPFYNYRSEHYGRYLSQDEYRPYGVRLTYNAGFDPVPSDVQKLVKDLIASEYKIATSGGRGLKSYSISDVRIEWSDKMTMIQYQTLDAYRKVVF